MPDKEVVISGYNWLQLTKDVLVPLSSTLVGAGVAYFVAKQDSRGQQRILEKERELNALERIYHLLQEYERYNVHCRDSYRAFLKDANASVDDLKKQSHPPMPSLMCKSLKD